MASVARPGRFLPGDPRVEEPYRLTPQLAFRVAIMAFLALAVFAVLFLRLWALQVLSGDRYLAVANDNRVRTLHLEAQRGPVLDRNGSVLVENVPGTRVELWPADLPKSWPAQRSELRASLTVDRLGRQFPSEQHVECRAQCIYIGIGVGSYDTAILFGRRERCGNSPRGWVGRTRCCTPRRRSAPRP